MMADNEKADPISDIFPGAVSAISQGKNGKTVTAAAKGITGPAGWTLLGIKNRKVIRNSIIVMVAFLLLPVVIMEMLPGVILGGFGIGDDTDNDSVKKAVFEDISVILENFDDAVETVNSVMITAHEQTVQQAYRYFQAYGVDDEMILMDDSASENFDAAKLVCDYSATTDFREEINLDTMREKFEEGENCYYRLGITEQLRTREQLVMQEDGSFVSQTNSYTVVIYTVTYIGDEYIEDDILGLTEEQKELSADYRESLEILYAH